jgi:hypothetical protein
MDAEGSLPCAQKPDIGPYRESVESSPHLLHVISLGVALDCSVIYS